jgi:hypothetical protein
MNLTLALFGWVANSLAYTMEVLVYSGHALWVTTVRAALAFLEVVDDWFPVLEILENAIWRFLVMGIVGFFLGVGLMIFLSFITGNWGIPCVFSLAIAFCAFVGLMADPEQDWSFGDFPSFGRNDNGPQTPLNL